MERCIPPPEPWKGIRSLTHGSMHLSVVPYYFSQAWRALSFMAHDLGSRKHLRPDNQFDYSAVKNNLTVGRWGPIMAISKCIVHC